MERRRGMVLALAAVMALAAVFVAAAEGAGEPGPAEPRPEKPGMEPTAVLAAVVDNLRGGPLLGTYTFVVQRPGRVTEYVMEIVSDGDERGLIRIVAPPREAGQAFLMDGDDLWLYNPRLGRSLRLPPSGRSGAFLGSDVSYNDLVGRDLEKDYVAAFASRDTESGDEGLLVLELTPRPGAPTPYGRVRLGVDEATLTPCWADYYDQRGQVVKRVVLSDYLTAGGRFVPRHMLVEDRTREGYRTVVRLTEVQLDAAVPEACFTLQALERGCR